MNDVVLQGREFEGSRQTDEGLRVAKDQIAARPQLLVQSIQQRLATIGVEVDHDVSAEDDVKLPHQAQRGLVHQVQVTKIDALTNVLAESEARGVLLKIAVAVVASCLAKRRLSIVPLRVRSAEPCAKYRCRRSRPESRADPAYHPTTWPDV